MKQYQLPEIFRTLQAEGYIDPSQICKTRDGFFLIYKSLADILLEKDILDFPDSEGVHLPCSSFFDDWFLYAVPNECDYVYSLLKLREQEHDAEDGAPADGDTPGVTISFVPFQYAYLLDCLAAPTEENRQQLNKEINRVVVHRRQRHHRALKYYFLDPRSEGAYLVARLYVKHIALFSRDGVLPLPEYYKELVQKSISYKSAGKFSRLPKFIASLNQQAGYPICDSEYIHIKDPAALTEPEAAAILATHTGNTSVYSFAAEVEYHAKFLVSIAKLRLPFFGKSVYDSAIRADMTVGDTEFEGPAPFYREDSGIVRRQYKYHRTQR